MASENYKKTSDLHNLEHNPALEAKQVDIKDSVTIPVSGIPELSVVNAIDQTAFDLNASAFSETSSISNDYRLNSIKLNFSTTESKTITVTGPDGTVLYQDTNTNQNVSLEDIGISFNADENFTVAVTQFSSAGTMDCIAVVEEGNSTLGGNPTLGASDEEIGRTKNTPQTTYYDNIALGNVGNSENRTILGTSVVGEGSANEQALGDGMTGRYPFPSAAAQMDVVSTDANDDSIGTGAQALLIRGNDASNVEVIEIIVMDGTTPVTTTTSYLRINSIFAVSVGSTGTNEGTITVKNGADILAQVEIGKNISRTAIFSIPDGFTGVFKGFEMITGKDDSAVVLTHLFPGTIGNIDLVPFELKTYQNQIRLGPPLSFALTTGTDIEFTAYSQTGTGDSTVSVIFQTFLIED